MYTAPIKTFWDFGSAYDLFISLFHLHNPEDFNIRPSWANGILNRLGEKDRKTLKLADEMMLMPLYFVHFLPKPKDTQTCLTVLEEKPESKRLEALAFAAGTPINFKELVLSTRPNHKWTQAEKNCAAEYFTYRGREVQPTFLEAVYQTWAHREEFGSDLLQALSAYYENFFAEEEQRILPVLRKGLRHAQMRAGSLSVPAMLEEISAGVRYYELENYKRLYLAPSFWSTPYLHFEDVDKDAILMVYGARPDNMALILGDIVPDRLLRGLKALADSTRLRILRDIALAPQTAAQLSRSLRLRPPTIAHHLKELRQAGVVQVIMDPEGESQYATRFDGFDTIQDLLTRFVHGD